ncbi:MAG TPA: PP0621 family protein [Pyrinomonadaceae bacterium]|nr:PP0621 family protein [Pyrinomonadaceae bacterium]
MKYLFVLALFAAVAFIIYWRLRPYLRGVRRFLGVLREVNRMRAAARGEMPREPAPRRRAAATTDKLVRCAACGTWATSSRAVNLGGATYCSHACLERSADSPHSRRKSAS